VNFDILTVVPEAVTGYLDASIIGRARTAGTIECRVTNIRDFATGKHRQVDDAPYGGGSGMVMQAEPTVRAIESAQAQSGQGQRVITALLSPAGQPFTQKLATDLADGCDQLILVCGRYEGIDARVSAYVDLEISVGDFVLTGGELAALSVVDAVARLLPGVLGNSESALEESFQGALLEYPQYTRPRDFRGAEVPEVLLSGDHQRIKQWRTESALERTRRHRPDLLEATGIEKNHPAELPKGLDSRQSGE